jgi:hypothetical protein
LKQLAFALILFSLFLLTGCYTEVVLPKHTVNKTKVDKDRIVNFTHTVIDTFDNEWLPDEGYYYQFRFDLKVIKEEKIDAFLNMLYAKGYDVLGAWYRPAAYSCPDQYEWNYTEVKPMFIVLLSDFDDSIIQHNLYAVMNKPYFPCPYNVWEFWSEE